MIEHVFEDRFRDESDAAVVAAIAEWQAAESAAAARKLSAIAELTRRRCAEGDRAYWSCDDWDGTAAEVSAALGISHGRASGQMQFALSLKLLPAVAALFCAGAISTRVAHAITWRTGLVTDADVRGRIDKALAAHAAGWDALSQYKLEQAIDVWVDRIDPGALRRATDSARHRDVTVGDQNISSGTTALWGRLYATDAALLERRLAEMARAVCVDDPRTLGERRADALGALAAGADHLSCQCGDPVCPASAPDGRAAAVSVYVLAEEAALHAAGDKPAVTPQRPRPAGSGMPTAVLLGGGSIPTPLLAELLRLGARVRPIHAPPTDPEPRYRPSTALTAFIRARDMTCRFPGCDVPAQSCDIDHSVPWPLGPAHPSNLSCACRKHHLLKTFHTGEGGWTQHQHPDGTIDWTSPTGQTYTTRPPSHALFPDWNTTTAPLPQPTRTMPATDRGLCMPARRRTRAAERTARIRRERALNDTHVAERNRPPPF